MGYDVVVVDDAATMRGIALRGRRWAGTPGMDFGRAGAEALVAADPDGFDLILSDLGLPTARHANAPPVVGLTTQGAKRELAGPFTPDPIEGVVGSFPAGDHA